MRHPWFPVALLCATSVLPAQADQKKGEGSPTSEKAEQAAVAVPAAIQTAADLLVQHQENYVPDPRVGRLRDDAALLAWQKRELERLAKLRADQKSRAEWPYEGVYRVRGSEPRSSIVPPGYRVGGSAIVCEALVLAPGFGNNNDRKQAVQRSIQFMLEELKENKLLAAGPKRGYDVRGWAHTYALEFFLLALRHKIADDKTAARMREMIPHLIRCIATNEVKPGGGWNYAGNSNSPFMTGSTLLALYQARAQGFEVDSGMVDRALNGLEKARTKSGSFVYSGTVRPARVDREGRRGGRGRRGRVNRRTAMPGACARASIAELCLYRAGRSDAKKLRVAVDAFFEHWGELLKRKSKQGTHVGAYGIAPYYFMYGHTYAAMAIEALPEKDRPALRKQMQETLWRTREEDGGWNDRIFPRSKSYSTAMAMLALMAPAMEPVPEWKTKSKKQAAPAESKKKNEKKKVF